MMGSDYVISFNNIEEYMSRFNPDQMNKLLMVFEELDEKGTAYHKHGQLKADQTAITRRIEFKGGNILHIRNFARRLFFSNNENTMYVETDDRRLTMHRPNNRFANNYDYFQPLWDEIRDEQFCRMSFEWFAERKYDDRSVMNAFDTQYKQDQRLKNLNNGIKFIIDCVNSGFAGIDREDAKYSAASLWSAYQVWCSDNRVKPNTKSAFRSQISVIGFDNPKTVWINAATKRGYNISVDALRDNIRAYLRNDTFEFDIVDH
jgi:putative DNA primase/helicase